MEIPFYHRIRQFLLLPLAMLMLTCQNEVTEISSIDDQLVFQTESELGVAIQRIALLDGSIDNILDQSNCLKLVLPVSILFDGQSLEINTESDLIDLVEVYNQNPYVGLPEIAQYPIELLNEQYELTQVNNEQELLNLASTCLSLEDEDIECIDLQYPIRIASYDDLNQIAGVSTVSSDEELFFLLKNIQEGNLLGLQFPIFIVNSEGEEEIVNDNFGFQSLLDIQGESCDEEDILYEDPGILPTTQTLSLLLTDAPFPFELIDQVNINIISIEVKTAESNDTIPYITIYDTPATFNMLDLTNGVTAAIGSAELPVGEYQFFRMFVDDGNVVMEDGEVFELKVPSGSQSGIKIQPEQNIIVTDGLDVQFLLDFDVSKSLVARGNPDSPNGINGFNFKPVVRAVNISNTGSVGGLVTDIDNNVPLPNATVSLIASDTIYSTSLTNDLGQYRIIGVTEGSYHVQIELDDYQSAIQENIQVLSSQESTVNFQLERE